MFNWRLFFIVSSLSFSLAATSICAEPLLNGKGQFTLAIGAGQYGSIQRQQKSTPFYLLPHWSYYNRRFYIDNLNLGVNLYESTNWSWDLTTKQSFDALLFHQHSLKQSFLSGLSSSGVLIALPWDSNPEQLFEPSRRRFSYLAGTTLYWRHDNWQLSSAYHKDISSVHQGAEWLTEARYLWRYNELTLAITGSARLLDNNYSNYYFGVSEQETSHVYSFQPGAQWLTGLKLESSWALTDRFRAILSWRREWLPADYKASIQLQERQHDILFTGVAYTW